MNELVLKFGGSSLSSARNVSNVADIIVEHYLNSDEKLDVVASAFGAEPGGKKENKITDSSLKVADYAFNGNVEGALKEVQSIKDIYYSILSGLRLDKSLVDPTLIELEEIVRDSTRKLKQAYFRFSQFTNKVLNYRDIKQKLPASVKRFLATKEKLDDATAGLGELASTPVVAALVQRKLEEKFKHLEDRLRQPGLNEREQKIYERLKSCDGQYTVVLDSREQGFITNSNFGNATLLDESLDRNIASHHIKARARNKNRILFYTGYVARDEYGNQTTLGRDGSNVTTIALASAIRTKEVIIYSDTDGVLIADPKFMGESQTARYLSYKEESLLAKWGGMKALQENSLYILNRKGVNIPINVRNSFNPTDPGTLITHSSIESRSNMKGIGILTNLSYREFPLGSVAEFEKIKEILENYDGITILWADLEVSNGSTRGKFLVKRDSKKEEKFGESYFKEDLYHKVQEEVYKRSVRGGFHYHDASLITICGENLGSSNAELSKIERILAGLEMPDKIRKNVYHFPIKRTRDMIQLVVRKEDADKVVKAIYNQLKRINIVLYGPGNVGLEFLKRVKDRYDELGLTVVGVVDTSGVYAKPGGFSAEELAKIIKMKRSSVSTEHMNGVHDAIYYPFGFANLQRVYELSKGDFVLVDATPDPSMLSTTLHALHLGSRVITVNKTPYAIGALPNGKDKALEYVVNRNVRKLFEAMFKRQLFNRGTVGADLGVPGTELEILRHNPGYVTVRGCASGSIMATCTGLDNGKVLSEAIQIPIGKGWTESTPWLDYAGLDVLNKFTILWREIATKYGKNFYDCDINPESFIAPAIRCYEQKTRRKFETSDLANLSKGEFVERMKLLDEAFAELRAELPENHVLRYVGEISYNPTTKRYSLNVGLKAVHKDSVLGNLEGRDNMFLFGVNGHPRKPYGIEPGPGAGIEETASAIMHDLQQINEIVRDESQAMETPYVMYKRQRTRGEAQEGIRWFGPPRPSNRALQFLAR